MGARVKFPAAVRELEFFADSADETLLVEAYCAPRTSAQDAESVAEMLTGILREAKGAVVFEVPPANQFVEPKRLAAFGKTAIVYADEAGGLSGECGGVLSGEPLFD